MTKTFRDYLAETINDIDEAIPTDEYNVEFEFTGDDGETGMGTLYYKVVNGKVDPKSLRGECEGDGNNKLDDELATAVVQPGALDHEMAMDAAQDDYEEGTNEAPTRARPIDPNSVFARLGNDIQSIMNDALDGNDMADRIADELGDYLRNGEAPEGSHYEKAIQIVMSSIHDGPQAQAEAAEEAISVLHSEEKNPKFADEDVDELARIRELANINEETYDGDDFYEAYGDLWFNEDDDLDEAEYQGRKVKLGKPMQGDVKKFKVYVKNPKGNVVKVNFGDPDMKIKKSNPARRRSFRARHNCDNPGPRHKARYWSCRKW